MEAYAAGREYALLKQRAESIWNDYKADDEDESAERDELMVRMSDVIIHLGGRIHWFAAGYDSIAKKYGMNAYVGGRNYCERPRTLPYSVHGDPA